MYAWEAIEQSLTFIEEHLTEEIYTEELANIVGLSHFYFQRLFKRLVNKPVQEYVKLRRLAKVIENRGDSEQRILDVALDYGFSSHANFTRAFKETYGITPEDYRRDLPMLNTFNTSVEMGMSHTEDSAQGLFNYFAGGLVQNVPSQLQGGFVKKELPAGEYIVCKIEAEKFEDLVTVALDQASKYLFGTWLPHHSLTTEPFSAEKYYRDLKDMACMEIWVKPLPLENKR